MERKSVKRPKTISQTSLKKCSDKETTARNRCKISKVIICVAINLVLIGAIWLVLVQPIVATLYFPPIEYKGLNIYISGDYTEYDNGQVFRSFISSLSFIDDAELTNFYYYDNKRSDNLIYGKQGDFFILELQLSDNYDYVKTNYELGDSYAFTYDDYCAYEVKLQDEQLNTDNRFLVMLCDKTKTARCVCRTDDRSSNITSVISALNNDCLLEWHVH